MTRKAAHLTLLLALVSLGESGVCADPPAWFPANPLQPAGRPRGGETPKATPTLIVPAAAPPEPAPQASSTAPPPFAAPERPKLLSCEDACSQAALRIVFALERGRIGLRSRVELEAGEPLEIHVYSDVCPHAEGKELAFGPENLPDGCVFVFVIPSSRATLGGVKARHDLRCSAGKIGMSGFHCNESSSPSSSFAGDALSRDP